MLTILRPGLPNEGEGRKLLSSLALPQLSSRTRTILTLIAVSGNTVLATFLNGALTVALPSIAKSIGMTQDLLSWPLAMFSLTSGALLLISGAMADAFGRRNVFLIGNVVFATICLIASFIKTAEPFIGCCAGLGVGAALLIPAGVGILGSSIPEGKLKNQSFALLGAAQPIGFIIGLILGGLLSTRWQVIFWILTGTTILFGACAILGLPRNGEELIQSRSPSSASLSSIARLNPTNAGSETGEQTPAAIGRLSAAGTSSATLPGLANMTGRAQANDTPTDRALRLKMFDWIGALMSTAGLVMLTFALADAETAPQGWQTPYVIALLPTSAFLLLAFLLWQRHLEKLQRIYELGASSTVGTRPGRNAHYLKAPPTTPLLPPAVWRAPKFGAVISVIFLAWLSFNVLSYLSTLVYQEVQQISAIKTSLLFLPMVGAGLVLNIFSGWAVGRVNAMWLVVFGASSGAAAALILSEGVDLHTPYYLGMLWVMILQVGPDVFFPAGNLYACKSVGRQHQALAGSLFNTTVRVSTSLGLAISSSIANAVTRRHSSSLSEAAVSRRSLQSAPSMIITSIVQRAVAASGSSSDAEAYSPEALMQGYKAASWFCFACSALAVVIAFIWLRNIGIVGGMESKTEDNAIELQRKDSAKDGVDNATKGRFDESGRAGGVSQRRP